MNFRSALLMLVAASMAFATEKVYVPYFGLTNIHKDYQLASSKLFQRYAEQDGRYEFVVPEAADTLIPQPTKEQAQKAAISKSCSKFILADMTRLGEGVTVSVSMYNTNDGSLRWSDVMKAKNPDDLDPILERMGKTIGTDQQASSGSDIYTVTQKESEKLRKKKANKSFGIGILGFTQVTDPGPQFQPGLEIFWSYDARNLFFQIDGSFNFYNDDEYNGNLDLTYFNMALGISAYYPFSDGDITPFLGGGLSFGTSVVSYEYEFEEDYYSYTDSDSESQSGIWARLGGGILFNRTSSVTFRLRAEYIVASYKLLHNRMNGPLVAVEIGF